MTNHIPDPRKKVLARTLEVLNWLIVINIILGAGYFSWKLERKFHWNFSYRSLVQEEIRRLVKPEALK